MQMSLKFWLGQGGEICRNETGMIEPAEVFHNRPLATKQQWLSHS
jgi:hypothetical protein